MWLLTIRSTWYWLCRFVITGRWLYEFITNQATVVYNGKRLGKRENKFRSAENVWLQCAGFARTRLFFTTSKHINATFNWIRTLQKNIRISSIVTAQETSAFLSLTWYLVYRNFNHLPIDICHRTIRHLSGYFSSTRNIDFDTILWVQLQQVDTVFAKELHPVTCEFPGVKYRLIRKIITGLHTVSGTVHNRSSWFKVTFYERKPTLIRCGQSIRTRQRRWQRNERIVNPVFITQN